MNSNSSKICYFPDFLTILNELIEVFPNDNIKQNRNNQFVIDCLNSIENTVEQRKYYQITSPLELLGYSTFLIITNHCLVDGNKRFFSIFFIEFIERNRGIIIEEFWTNLELDLKVEMTLNLFNDIENKIKEDLEIDEMVDYIILWILKFIIFGR